MNNQLPQLSNCDPPLVTGYIEIPMQFRDSTLVSINKNESHQVFSGGSQLIPKHPGKRGRPRGTVLSEETKTKISVSRKGQKLSPAALAKRLSKRPPQPSESPDVVEWTRVLYFAVRRRRKWLPRNVGLETLRKYAKKLARVGPPSDPDAQGAFHAVLALFFQRHRLDWTEGLSLNKYEALVPDDREKFLRIADCARAAEMIPGPGIEKAKYSLKSFIEIAVQVPVTHAVPFVSYILADRDRKERTVRAIFCQETFDYWKGRLRGLVSDLADPDYAEQIRQKIKTIRGSEEVVLPHDEQIRQKIKTIR